MISSRAVALGLVLAAAAAPSAAQPAGSEPADLAGLGVEEHLGAPLPLELPFTAADGREVTLGELFAPGRPVLLVLAYYRCPMLCTLVLDALVETLREMEWTPGERFDVVTVSIDPREGPDLARLKQQGYVRAYGRPESAAGWHFLTGTASSIERLADATGFRYRYLEARQEYAHPAVLFVITPEGRLSRYLYGVKHDPRTVRLSLVESAGGGIGSAVDRVLLFCYRYDPAQGRYTAMAWRLMRVGGALTALVLGSFLLALWRREARQRRHV